LTPYGVTISGSSLSVSNAVVATPAITLNLEWWAIPVLNLLQPPFYKNFILEIYCGVTSITLTPALCFTTAALTIYSNTLQTIPLCTIA
jgi:hypothetical protein